MCKEALTNTWSVMKDYNTKTNNRGLASGYGYIFMNKQDGTKSQTNRAPPLGQVISGTVGFYERTPRRPYCRPMAWNQEHPEKLKRFELLCQETEKFYSEVAPAPYLVQKSHADQSCGDYLIGGSVFTTLTLNKNFRTAAHRDAGNLPGAFNCMAYLRQGVLRGGELVLCDYRVGIKFNSGDVICFDPFEVHGNLPIISNPDESTRCTIVLYYRDGIQQCLPMEQELQRVQNRQLGDALEEE